MDLRERVARVMFEEDERDRHATSKIPQMSWNNVGELYQDRWRARADAAIAACFEWQPIETAPKDEWVLGIRAGTKLPMVSGYDEDDGWFPINHAFQNWTPTHWLPLPPPPK